LVVHRLKKTGEEVLDILNKKAPDIANTTASGSLCKCLKTWSPLAYGREDYLFCLWQANKQQDVEAIVESLGLMEYLSVDTMRVDEIDWKVLGKRKS
jgi:hypothetical protein